MSQEGDGADEPGWIARVVRAMRRPRGARRWSVYLRTTAVLGVVGIGLTLAFPRSGALVGFAIYTLWVTGQPEGSSGGSSICRLR